MILRTFLVSLALTALSFFCGGVIYSEHVSPSVQIAVQLLRNFVIYFAVFFLIFYFAEKLKKRK